MSSDSDEEEEEEAHQTRKKLEPEPVKHRHHRLEEEEDAPGAGGRVRVKVDNVGEAAIVELPVFRLGQGAAAEKRPRGGAAGSRRRILSENLSDPDYSG